MEQKIYVDGGLATFRCPQCDTSKTVDVTSYVRLMRKIEVRCKCRCGYRFNTFLERRRYARKDILLPGIFTRHIHGTAIEKGTIVVLELSRSGLKFKPHVEPGFKIGDKVKITFNLNNKAKSLIKKEAVIKNITQSHFVGTEFCSKDQSGPISAYVLR